MNTNEKARDVIQAALGNLSLSRSRANAILSALAKAGLVITSRELTRDMLNAAGNDLLGRTIWDLMLTADIGATAPASPSPAVPHRAEDRETTDTG